MPAEEVERGLAPERAAPMGHEDREIGEVLGDVIEVHGVSELGPRTREHGGAGVDHDGHPKPLRGLVDRAERRQPSVHVPVRGEQLMGRMDLHAAHLPL